MGSATLAIDKPANASLFEGRQLPPPPTGCVWVEWVGEASPLDSPVVRFNLIRGKYTREQRKVIKELSRVRIARVHRHTRTILRGNGMGQIPNLGEPMVRFGPSQVAAPGTRGSFLQAVPFKAADAIKSASCGHEFIIHNERDGEQVNHITIQETGLKLQARDSFGSSEQFRKEMGW